MAREQVIRIIAGSFVLISLLLAQLVSPHWLWFTAFVGVNLIQSGFTKWCLMDDILRKVGVGGGGCCCSAGAEEQKKPAGGGCCGGH